MGNNVSAKLCYCLEPWEEGEEPYKVTEDDDKEEVDSDEWLVRASGAELPDKASESFFQACWEHEQKLPVAIKNYGHYRYPQSVLCARLENDDDDTLDLVAMAAKEPELRAALETFCKSANIPCTDPGWRIISFYG